MSSYLMNLVENNNLDLHIIILLIIEDVLQR